MMEQTSSETHKVSKFGDSDDTLLMFDKLMPSTSLKNTRKENPLDEVVPHESAQSKGLLYERLLKHKTGVPLFSGLEARSQEAIGASAA